MAMFTAAVVMAAGLAAVAAPALAQTKEDKSAKAKPAKDQKPARDLPALPSAPASKPVLDMPTVGNFANSAPGLPGGPPVGTGPKAVESAFDPARSVLVEDETTPTKAVYSNPGGSKTAMLTQTPKRFRDPATGKWREIDTALQPGPGGLLSAKSAPKAPRLAPSAEADVASIDSPKGPVRLRYEGAKAVAATTKDNKATYAKALEGRDLVLSVTAEGFKESVVLADAGASPSYRSQLVLPEGVAARQAKDGVELIDAAGAVMAPTARGWPTTPLSRPIPTAPPPR